MRQRESPLEKYIDGNIVSSLYFKKSVRHIVLLNVYPSLWQQSGKLSEKYDFFYIF